LTRVEFDALVPEVSCCCLTRLESTKARNERRETLRLISSLISSRTAISCAWDWPLPASRLNAFPHATAVLLIILGTLVVVYHGTAKWSAVHRRTHAVYQSTAAYTIAPTSTFPPARHRLPICRRHVPFHASPEHFLSLRPLGLRSDVIHSLVLRTTPACIASFPWRMTDRCSHLAGRRRKASSASSGLRSSCPPPARPANYCTSRRICHGMSCTFSPASRRSRLDALSCRHETSLHARINIMCSERRRCRGVSLATEARGMVAWPCLSLALCIPRDRVKVRPCRLARSLNGGNSPSTVASA
jgi:hypothetical protein